VEGLNSIAQAYADVGMRAVIAPMIADRSFYQAIPDLLDAFPPELRAVADAMRTAPGEATLAAMREAAASGRIPATASVWASRRPFRCIVPIRSCAAAAIWRSNSVCRCRRIWRSPASSAPRH
jgi:hypothetical protein